MVKISQDFAYLRQNRPSLQQLQAQASSSTAGYVQAFDGDEITRKYLFGSFALQMKNSIFSVVWIFLWDCLG